MNTSSNTDTIVNTDIKANTDTNSSDSTNINANYLRGKFLLFGNNIVDNIPLFLSSVFIFIIFYAIAEYYKSLIIPPKIKLTKSETVLIQEMRQEIQSEIDQGIPVYDSSLIYNQLSWLVYYSILVFGAIVSFVNLGFNVTTIITILGSTGFALALAIQDSLKNIISGIYISINKLFKIGDIVSLKPLGNLNATHGRIIDFSLYYTTIVDSNNIISMIPNSVVQNNIITNITLSEHYNDK